MKAKCIIVDDEPIAIEVIKSHLRHFDKIELVASCGNALEAGEIISSTHIDLIFLDIHMPEISGLTFLKSISNPPKVIITTAFRDYALEGYDFDVVDFLLKPISLDRFLKAIQKFMKQYYASSEMNDERHTVSKFMYVRAERKNIKLVLEQIEVIESLKDYLKIQTSEKLIITKEQISRIEKNLPNTQFLRIHRSYIVAIDKIEAFNHESIFVNGKEYPIGRSYKQQVAEMLNPPLQ